jgi:hypothetical protein
MCFGVSTSSAAPSVAFLSSSLIAYPLRSSLNSGSGTPTARQGQRRSSAKNPLHDLLLILPDRREVD